MTSAMLFEIIDLVVSLLKSQATPGTPEAAATVASTLMQIVQKGAQAYKQQVGQALDPSLINVENPV